MGAKQKKITQKMRNLSEELEDRHNSDLFHSLFDLHNLVSEHRPEMIHVVEAEMEKQFAWGVESQSEIEFMLKYATKRVRSSVSKANLLKIEWAKDKFGLIPEELAHQVIINLITHGSGYDPSLPVGKKKAYIKMAVENTFNDLIKAEKDKEKLKAEIVPFDPDRDDIESNAIDPSEQARLVVFINRHFTSQDNNELKNATQENFGKVLKRLLNKYNFEF